MTAATDATWTIVAAYLAHHRMRDGEAVADLVDSVRATLERLAGEDPAVPIESSVARDHVVCLNCGRSMRSLKRHLIAIHHIAPRAYRARWGLPANYPMTCEEFSDAAARRSRRAWKRR